MRILGFVMGLVYSVVVCGTQTECTLGLCRETMTQIKRTFFVYVFWGLGLCPAPQAGSPQKTYVLRKEVQKNGKIVISH